MTISSQPAIGGIATEIHYTGFFLRGTDRGCVCAPVDVVPELEAGAGRGAVVEALKGHVVAKGLLVGVYERAG